MSNRGFDVPFDESYAAIESRTASWAFIWSATVRTWPTVPAAGRRRTFHFSLFPYLIRGHTLSDIVAVLGSLKHHRGGVGPLNSKQLK